MTERLSQEVRDKKMSPFNSELRQELHRLLDEAAPGDWSVGMFLIVSDEDGMRVADFDNCENNNEANATLIAKSKNALPALLASAERLEKVEKALQAIVDFDSLPVEAKRPDVFRLRLEAARAALNGEDGQ